MKSNSEFMALKEDMGDLCKSRQILLSVSVSVSVSLFELEAVENNEHISALFS